MTKLAYSTIRNPSSGTALPTSPDAACENAHEVVEKKRVFTSIALKKMWYSSVLSRFRPSRIKSGGYARTHQDWGFWPDFCGLTPERPGSQARERGYDRQMAPHIRILNEADAPAYRAVRLAVLESDPRAFVTTAAEFAARPLESVAGQLHPREDSVTFGAFVGGELMGILTVARETRTSIQHRANVFGVGVLDTARGQGCGDALLKAGVAQVRAWPGVSSLHLTVTETQHAARRLYERHGFRTWGTQPDALRHGEQSLAEHWMWLPLGS